MNSRSIIIVVLTALILLGTTYLHATTVQLPIGSIDFPITTEHGWPLPWLAETRFTDPIGSTQSPQYEMLWQALVVDSFLFLIIGIIVSFGLRRRRPF